MTEKTKKLLTESECAIRALREYIQALPDDVVAKLPAMPGVDGDWLDVLQANLKAATEAPTDQGQSMKTECRHCGSSKLSWFCKAHNKSDVQEGRLRTSDVGVLFVQGCDECSETLQVESGDKVAKRLNLELAAAQAAASEQ